MFTDLIAEQMRLPERDRDLLRWAAILHDIGKLRVPVSILNKPGKPDDDEWAALKAHPSHGADIAGALLPWLGEWGHVIVEHHERWDGTGYPNGLAGREIHPGSRIVSVADAYDVMTSARAYKRPVSRAAAYQELIRFSGTQFDPAAVRAMVSVSAPRLRRAQGLLAWLADVPLVATHVVPATTLARVVGAGAVATGVVAGGGLSTPPVPTPMAAIAAPSAAGQLDEHPSRGLSIDPSATGRAPLGERRGPRSPGAGGPTAAPVAGSPAAEPDGEEPVPATPPTGAAEQPAPAAPSPAGTPKPSSTGGSGSSSSGSSGSGSSGSGSLGDTVDDVTGGLTGTVDGVTGGAVDGVTDTVDGTVDDLTDTVDDTVGGLLGGVGGLLGGR
jgi:hypothetical protein